MFHLSKNYIRMILLLIIFLGFTLAGSGCAGSQEGSVEVEDESSLLNMTLSEATTEPSPTLTPSPTPRPTVTPSPTLTPTPSPVPEPDTYVKAMLIQTPCYAKPSLDAKVLAYLDYEMSVGYLSGPDSEGFIEVLLPDQQIGYCLSEHMADQMDMIYAKTIDMHTVAALPLPEDADPEAEQEKMHTRLVDLRLHAPEILVYTIFATTDNFTGVQQYKRPICLIQEDTLIKLKKAQDIFSRDGYTIKVYDAYRPYRVTMELANYLDNPIYLASPKTGSHHNRGVAVDMTLVDAMGTELEMPSPMHTLDSRSGRSNPDMTPEARRNMDYMSAVMQQAGFLLYEHEWWHFTDSQRSQYPVLNLCLGEIEVEARAPVSVTGKPPLKHPADTGYVSVSPTPEPTPTPTPTPEPTPTLTPTPEPEEKPKTGANADSQDDSRTEDKNEKTSEASTSDEPDSATG